MPPLKNARHEAFARELAGGKTADEAYQVAGYRPNRCNASRLLNTNENIKARVAELQQAAAEKTLVTIESLTRELEEARLLGMSNPRGASAAVSAVVAKAKLHGLITDKTEHRIETTNKPLHEWSQAELIAAIRRAANGDVPPLASGDGADSVH